MRICINSKVTAVDLIKMLNLKYGCWNAVDDIVKIVWDFYELLELNDTFFYLKKIDILKATPEPNCMTNLIVKPGDSDQSGLT